MKNTARGLVLLGVAHAFTAQAQNEEDLLRYSSIVPGGGARAWGMGGAMGAVGADPSAATINPAGFGLYSTSEFSFTPAFEVNDAKAQFYGTTASNTDNRFHFNNLSLMLSHTGEKGSDWRGGTFGISVDRQASYHWDRRAVGNSVNSSIIDKFIRQADGTTGAGLADAFPFASDLAYQTYLIDPINDSATTYTSVLPYQSPVKQQHVTNAAGRLNTTSIYYGANYLDKLYVGMAVGIQGTRYERTTTHTETVLDPTVDLKDFSYVEKLLTTGSGVDVKLGVIGRVGPRLRLGGSFHSPMWLRLNDSYSYSMSSNFRTADADGRRSYSADSPDGTFGYRARTPWRAVGSAAYVVGKHGVVSVDYMYSDMRQARLTGARDMEDVYDFAAENEVVREQMRGTHSLRVGTEWRSGNWYFRGGWGIWPDYYADKDARQGTAYKRFTGGIGFRTDHVSIDLAGVYGTRDAVYYPYDADLVGPVTETLSDTRGMLTIAFRP